jgi:hypothetical protein
MNFDSTLVNAPVTADREPELPEPRVWSEDWILLNLRRFAGRAPRTAIMGNPLLNPLDLFRFRLIAGRSRREWTPSEPKTEVSSRYSPSPTWS